MKTHVHRRSADMNMNYGMFWKFLSMVMLALALAAAEPPSALTCTVIQETEGFSYVLSRPPKLPGCQTGWESKNNTVVARNSNYGPMVQNLTNRSITLKDCQSYLHYTSDCFEGWEEAHCNIDCSPFLDLKENLTTTVNSTLICITKSWCLTEHIFGLCVTGMVIFVVGVVLVALRYCNICKKGRESTTTRYSYTLANGENEREQVEMKGVTVKT